MRRATLDQEGEALDPTTAVPPTDRRLRRAALAGAVAASDGGIASDVGTDPDDEDGGMGRLLAEQHAFLTSQQAPAARLLRRDDPAAGRDQRLPRAPVPSPSSATASAPPATTNGHAHPETAADTAAAPVLLGGVVEREVACKPLPIAIGGPSGGGGGTSRFAAAAKGFPQAVYRRERAPPPPKENEESSDSESDHEEGAAPTMGAGAGLGASAEMEAENLARLARMSPGELQVLQAEAMALFSPEALAVLQARGRPPSQAQPEQQVNEVNEEKRERRRAELLSRDLRTEAALAAAVEELLDEEERAKLAWTRPVGEGEEEGEQGPDLLRVDLEGRVLNGDAIGDNSPPRHSGLYHNPEQRAGYTLPYLCATARSSHTRQRALALRTLALLLRNPTLGPALHRKGERLPVALPLVLVKGALGDRHRAARVGAMEALAALCVGEEEEGAKDAVMEVSFGEVGLPPSVGPFVRFGAAGVGGEEEGEEDMQQQEEEEASDPFAREEERALDAADAAEEKRLLPVRENGPPVEGLEGGEEEEGAVAEEPVGTACAREFARDAPLALHRWGLLRALARRVVTASTGGEEGNVDVELLPALVLLGWAAHRGQGVARRVALGYDERLLDACARLALEGATSASTTPHPTPSSPTSDASLAATALATLRRLAQGSRAACLALGARGLLRASKGLLGFHPAAAASDSDDEGNDDRLRPNEARGRLVLEALRLWRVALRHGADLESLLDTLALLAGENSGGGGAGAGLLSPLPAHWPGAAIAAWYRCLEQACFTAAAAAQWRAEAEEEDEKGKGEEDGEEAPRQAPFPAAALTPATLSECGERLAVLALGAWRAEEGEGCDSGRWGQEMRMDLGNLEMLRVRVARLHFVAGAVEAGMLPLAGPMWGQLTAMLHALLDIENDGSPLFAPVAALKQQLLLYGRVEGEEGGPLLLSLMRVDLLYALVRLAARLLAPSSSEEDTPASAAGPLAFLQRTAAALDQREAWQQAAREAAGSRNGNEAAPVWAWAARRLLARTEAAALEALLLLPSSSTQTIRAQARRLLPLCAPGQEWEARGLLALGLEDGETETLPRLFTSVLADPAAVHQGRLLVGERGPLPARGSLLLSPRLAPPHTLLPLPPHWLLLPLASSLVTPDTEGAAAAGGGMATTTRILHATLRFLLREQDVWPTYTALLPPGLPLYYLLCLGLFPYEAFTGPTGTETARLAAELGRRVLQPLASSPSASILPALLIRAAAVAEGARPAEQGNEGEQEEQRLVALGEDLLGAAIEGGVSPPAAWAMRLLLRRAWGAHPCRVELWRGLHRAGMLHTLDFDNDDQDSEEAGAHVATPYLQPAERAGELLDLYAEALAGTAALAPLAPGKGGLAWLVALRHLGAHVWGGGGDGEEGPSAAARRRLGRVLRGVVAAAATLDGGGAGFEATAVCLLGYRGLPAAVLEKEGEGEQLTVRAAVARLAAWSQDVRAGRVALVLGAKEHGALAGLLAEGEDWRRVMEQACPQELAAVGEEGK